MQDVNNIKQPVTYRFRNIGPVKDAELELGDLTVIAGRNNTGKTYIVYTLYGFLQSWKDSIGFNDFVTNENAVDDRFPDLLSLIEKVKRGGQASFSLNAELLAQQRKAVAQEIARTFSERALPTVFSTQHGDFERSSIDLNISEIGSSYVPAVKYELRRGVSIEYNGSDVVIIVDNPKNRSSFHRLRFLIFRLYLRLLLRDLLPDPFILSAERFGISLFYRELDFTKNQLVDILQKLGDDKNREKISPYLFIERATSRYALPIKDNIDYTRSIPDLRKRKSEIYNNKLFDDIKDMMGGYYGTSGGQIRFISKARGKERSFNIPLHLASSSARGLSDFYFFLRHVAKSNHLLIIDEPESHLDTTNQILLARLLARFARAGLKVLITTHSDYLVKEINNLVMLSRPFADKDSVIKKLKYETDDFLEPESIRAYVAEENGLKRCTIDKFGIDMPVFDTTIDKINNAANQLASRVAEDSEG